MAVYYLDRGISGQMRINIPFTGHAYEEKSLFISPEECINFYLHPYPSVGEEEKFALIGTPGLELFYNPSVSEEVRALIPWGGYLYMVVGDEFRRVTKGGTGSLMGNLDTVSGKVSIATNGLDIIIVDGPNGYVYDLTSEEFTTITDPNFPGGDNVVQVDGYYLVNRPRTGQIYRSDWNDGLSWGGLAFSTAGGDPDNIVSLIIDHLNVAVIGGVSTELWYNTGAAIFNFARIDGAFIEQGGVSNFARTKINNAIYWLGRDNNGQGQIFQALGRQPKTIGTFPISQQISTYTDLSDAIMFSYQQEGHAFVVLTFPTDSVTWVYDSTVGFWHQRSSIIDGVAGRWRANCHALFDDNHIVGDYTNGKLYKLKTDVYEEDGEEIISIRTAAIIRDKQDRITADSVQVITEPAVGLTTGDAEDINPQAMFSWSKDGGRNFSAEVDVPLGKIGEYENRANIHQLGQGRNWVFRIRISAAVKRVILGAVMEAEKDDG